MRSGSSSHGVLRLDASLTNRMLCANSGGLAGDWGLAMYSTRRSTDSSGSLGAQPPWGQSTSRRPNMTQVPSVVIDHNAEIRMKPRLSPRRELAHREGAGLDVTLLWFGAETLVVLVCDSRNGTYLEIPAEPQRALDIYYHPFAYRNRSTIDYEDGRLAA